MKNAVIVSLVAVWFCGLKLAADPSIDNALAQDEVRSDTESVEKNDASVEPEQAELKDQWESVRDRKNREAKNDPTEYTTEYTMDPNSVEIVVEMDPNGTGFRTRNHRMTLSSDIDLIFRGRGMLRYDYRFFNYFSMGLMAGIDWSDLSLYSRFRDHLAKPTPWQFSVLGGVAGKWRLTEWYMRTAFFLEPSLLFGYMWQSLPIPSQNTRHWRLRPGIFGGFENVFDSGFALNARVGVEFPIDFGQRNPYKEVAEPLLMIGFGFAI